MERKNEQLKRKNKQTAPKQTNTEKKQIFPAHNIVSSN